MTVVRRGGHRVDQHVHQPAALHSIDTLAEHAAACTSSLPSASVVERQASDGASSLRVEDRRDLLIAGVRGEPADQLDGVLCGAAKRRGACRSRSGASSKCLSLLCLAGQMQLRPGLSHEALVLEALRDAIQAARVLEPKPCCRLS
jgi:hypothetical protein